MRFPVSFAKDPANESSEFGNDDISRIPELPAAPKFTEKERSAGVGIVVGMGKEASCPPDNLQAAIR